MTFTGPGTVAIASLLVIVSNIGFSVGESMNSAFLPELAKPESLGRVSGWGWSLGYGGGLVTLALCLIVLQIAGAFDIPQTESVPAVSLVVAVVFAVTALPFFLWVKERSSAGAVTESFTATVLASFKEMRGTLELIPAYRDFAWLTCCGFLYQCGIATVIALAAVYASAVMGLPSPKRLSWCLPSTLRRRSVPFVLGTCRINWGTNGPLRSRFFCGLRWSQQLLPRRAKLFLGERQPRGPCDGVKSVRRPRDGGAFGP